MPLNLGTLPPNINKKYCFYPNLDKTGFHHLYDCIDNFNNHFIKNVIFSTNFSLTNFAQFAYE